MCLFVFNQEQSSESGWHGSWAIRSCLQTSSPHSDLYCAASLCSNCSNLGHLLHPLHHRCHHHPCHPAAVCLLKQCPLLPFLCLQHTVPQDTQFGCPGDIYVVFVFTVGFTELVFLFWFNYLKVTNFFTRLLLLPSSLQVLLLSFVFLTLIITYLKVLRTARAVSASDQASARNACNTILLHGVQLLICMLSYVSPFINLILVTAWPSDATTIFFTTYLFTNVFPRLLSPLIYGVRDSKFSSYMRLHFCCKCRNLQNREKLMVGPRRSSKHVLHWLLTDCTCIFYVMSLDSVRKLESDPFFNFFFFSYVKQNVLP